MSSPTEQDMNGSQLNKALAGAGGFLIILAQATVGGEPGEGALDHPAAGEADHTRQEGEGLDPFPEDGQAFQTPLGNAAVVGPISPELLPTALDQARQALEEPFGAVPVLNVG